MLLIYDKPVPCTSVHYSGLIPAGQSFDSLWSVFDSEAIYEMTDVL